MRISKEYFDEWWARNGENYQTHEGAEEEAAYAAMHHIAKKLSGGREQIPPHATVIQPGEAGSKGGSLADLIKTAISSHLGDALKGNDESLRLEGRFIRWGEVENRMHKSIEAILSKAKDV